MGELQCYIQQWSDVHMKMLQKPAKIGEGSTVALPKYPSWTKPTKVSQSISRQLFPVTEMCGDDVDPARGESDAPDSPTLAATSKLDGENLAQVLPCEEPASTTAPLEREVSVVQVQHAIE